MDGAQNTGQARHHATHHATHRKHHVVHTKYHGHAAKQGQTEVNVNHTSSRESEDSEAKKDREAIKTGTKEGITAVGPFEVPKKYRVPVKRLVLVGSAFVPLALAIVLVVLLLGKPFGGDFYNLVVDNPSDSAVVVTVAAAILAYLNVLVVSNLLGFMHISLADNPVLVWMLDNVGLGLKRDEMEGGGDDLDDFLKKYPEKFNELRKLVRETSWRAIIIGLVAFALLALPHLLWTGALTPNYVSYHVTVPGLAFTPEYSQASQQNWANNSLSDYKDCQTTYPQSDGAFNGCAAASLSGSLYDDLSLGTAVSKQNVPNSKNDDSIYSYYGRSYGVGSAVGIYNSNVDSPTAFKWSPSDGKSIVYNETGYYTTVQCTTNSSSAWSLSTAPSQQSTNDSKTPSIFQASGLLPNSDWSRGGSANQSYSVIGFSIDRAVAWAVQSSGGGSDTQDAPQFMVAIAAGSNYSMFDKMQCAVSFTPQLFTVAADLEEGTISVTRPNVNPQPTFDETRLLAYTAMNQLGILSELQASPYNSQLGESLLDNVLSTAASGNNNGSSGGNSSSSSNSNSTALQSRSISADTTPDMYADSVANSIQVALDDILVFVASGQYYVAGNSSQPQDAELAQNQIRIGKDSYGFTVLVFNVLLFVALIVKFLIVAFGPERSGEVVVKHQSARKATIWFQKQEERKMREGLARQEGGDVVQTSSAQATAPVMQVGDDGTGPLLVGSRGL